MTELERNFACWASSGICDICGDHTLVIADITTLKCRCMACCVRERLAWEEKEKQRKRIPLNVEGFAEL